MLSGPALAESSRHLGRTALHLNVKAGYSAIDARDERLPSTVDLPAVLRFLTQGAWCAQATHFFSPIPFNVPSSTHIWRAETPERHGATLKRKKRKKKTFRGIALRVARMTKWNPAQLGGQREAVMQHYARRAESATLVNGWSGTKTEFSATV